LGMAFAIFETHAVGWLRLTLCPGTLVLRTDDCGDASAEIEIPCGYSGEKTELVFEPGYFMETIKRIDTECLSIRFDFRKTDTAILPVHSGMEAEAGHDHFFILAQKIKRGSR